MDVAVLQWPERERDRLKLARTGLPRLLLVAPWSMPPVMLDDDEDWVRLPAADVDVRARIAALQARRDARTVDAPSIDDDGIISFAGRRVFLAPVQARVMRALVADFTGVVAREDLVAAAWPDEHPLSNALDVHMARLRRRIRPLGLTIHALRLKGFALTVTDVDTALESS